MKAREIQANTLAASVVVNKTTMSGWRSGRGRPPAPAKRRQLERELRLPVGWLEQAEVPEAVPPVTITGFGTSHGAAGASSGHGVVYEPKGRSYDSGKPGWLFGDPREAEDAFRTYIRESPYRTSRAMVGDDSDLPADFIRQYRLNQIELARISCREGGRPIPPFVHVVENEIITGNFR